MCKEVYIKYFPHLSLMGHSTLVSGIQRVIDGFSIARVVRSYIPRIISSISRGVLYHAIRSDEQGYSEDLDVLSQSNTVPMIKHYGMISTIFATFRQGQLHRVISLHIEHIRMILSMISLLSSNMILASYCLHRLVYRTSLAPLGYIS